MLAKVTRSTGYRPIHTTLSEICSLSSKNSVRKSAIFRPTFDLEQSDHFLGRSGILPKSRTSCRRLARGFSTSGTTGGGLSAQERASMTEEEKFFYEYEQIKKQSNKDAQADKRVFKEKFAFREDQRKRIRLEATEKIKTYLARYKFMSVIEEQLLNDTLKALLSVNNYSEIDPERQVPAMLDSTIDKIFTLRSPEVVFNIFQLVVEHSVPITEESSYQLTAVLISWGPRLDYRQQLSVLNTVPAAQFDKYKDIFHSYENLFIDFFAQGFTEKPQSVKSYAIEMLKVFRKVNYDRLSFVESMEDLIFDSLPALSTFCLTQLISYTVQTEDMGTERRLSFIERLDNEVINRARLFNETEAVDVLFHMVKSAVGSHLARRLLVTKASENLRLLTKEKILVLITVLGSIEDRYKEKMAAIAILKDYVG